jgi:hypothetical protein
MLAVAFSGDLTVPTSLLWASTGIYLAASLTGLYGVTRNKEKSVLKQYIATNK